MIPASCFVISEIAIHIFYPLIFRGVTQIVIPTLYSLIVCGVLNCDIYISSISCISDCDRHIILQWWQRGIMRFRATILTFILWFWIQKFPLVEFIHQLPLQKNLFIHGNTNKNIIETDGATNDICIVYRNPTSVCRYVRFLPDNTS